MRGGSPRFALLAPFSSASPRLLTSGNTAELGQPPVDRRLASLKSRANAGARASLLASVAEAAGSSLRSVGTGMGSCMLSVGLLLAPPWLNCPNGCPGPPLACRHPPYPRTWPAAYPRPLRISFLLEPGSGPRLSRRCLSVARTTTLLREATKGRTAAVLTEGARALMPPIARCTCTNSNRQRVSAHAQNRCRIERSASAPSPRAHSRPAASSPLSSLSGSAHLHGYLSMPIYTSFLGMGPRARVPG